MPIDYKRFNGPEELEVCGSRPKIILKNPTKTKDLIDQNGLRMDGRQTDTSRNIFACTKMVSQAKGSAVVEMNKTKVICSVFDPREIPHQNEFSHLGELYCEVKFAPFSCPRQRRPHVPDNEEKALAVALRQALEPAVCRHLFPNFQVDIFVYILEHDGACLAAAITAAGLALSNAAVPMYDIITSSSAAVIGDKIFIDPTESEEYLAMTSKINNHGVVTVSMLSEMKQVSNLNQIGSMDPTRVMEVFDVLEKECEKIVPVVQSVLVSNVKSGVKEKVVSELEAKEREAKLDAKLEEWAKKLKAG